MSDVETGGLLRGEFREPHNGFQQAQGSIHNDQVASKLGFKGGTVPGSVHMDQFMPLLVGLYGPEWFKTGDMSLHFTQATVDREKVQATARPDKDRAHLEMFNEAGQRICIGTASLHAPDAGAELVKRLAEQAPAEEGRLRILADYKPGDTTRDIAMTISRRDLDRSLSVITERLPIYDELGALPPSHVVRLAHISRPIVLAKAKDSVGLFGALEVRQFKGPLVAGRDYVGRTTMLKLTESPRTENAWYDVDIADAASGQDVASVTFMIRLMKASSPLWAADGVAPRA
jgi:hypothetical protein